MDNSIFLPWYKTPLPKKKKHGSLQQITAMEGATGLAYAQKKKNQLTSMAKYESRKDLMCTLFLKSCVVFPLIIYNLSLCLCTA